MSIEKIVLTPEPLSKDAFAPFGDVIAVDNGNAPIMINEGTTERFHKLATVELNGKQKFDGAQQAQSIISIFRAQPRSLPMPITMMERHPLGSQAFLPSDNDPYLVLVCLGEDAPNPETLKLFVAKGEGVNYSANTWHHPLLALDKVSNFWIVDRAGQGNNLEEQNFSSELKIEIPSDLVAACIEGMK